MGRIYERQVTSEAVCRIRLPAVILFYGEGRFGNQIFQYQAISQITKPGERIVAVGLEHLERSLTLYGPKLFVLTRVRLFKLFFKHVLLPLTVRPLSRTLRLFNYATEPWDGQNNGLSGVLSMRAGLFRNLTFVDGGHYQNSAYWTELFPVRLLRISPALRAAAQRNLASIRAAGNRPVFVHIRRADYLTHSDFGVDNLSLPLDYYRAAIAQIEYHVKNAYLVFVTDDPRWAEENFADIPDKLVLSLDAATDFAIMAECDAGILSNSTFSLAAALMLNEPAVVLGPKYWFGFRAHTWYPPKIEFQHPLLHYLPVSS